MSAFKKGEAVFVQYTGYRIRATVIEPEDQFGWVTVRQDSDYDERDVALDERPVFPAAAEYIYRDGDAEPLSPMAHLAQALGYDV